MQTQQVTAEGLIPAGTARPRTGWKGPRRGECPGRKTAHERGEAGRSLVPLTAGQEASVRGEKAGKKGGDVGLAGWARLVTQTSEAT